METQYHKWLKDDTIKVKLMKMSKGYQWEITYEHEDDMGVIARIKRMDDSLRDNFGNKEE